MGIYINNNYGPNFDVHDGGVVNLFQDKDGRWPTGEKEIQEAEIMEEGEPHNGGDSPIDLIVQRAKDIMKEAEKDNGKEKPITARGNGGTYTYNIEGKAFGKAMDKLLSNYKDCLKDYLEDANADMAVRIKYVGPFLGAVLDTHLFSPSSLQKIDLEPAFNTYYGEGSSAVTKLNPNKLSKSGYKLIEILKQITEKPEKR